MEWINRAMAATLNNKHAVNGGGFIKTYMNPMKNAGKIFSISLRWALRRRNVQFWIKETRMSIVDDNIRRVENMFRSKNVIELYLFTVVCVRFRHYWNGHFGDRRLRHWQKSVCVWVRVKKAKIKQWKQPQSTFKPYWLQIARFFFYSPLHICCDERTWFLKRKIAVYTDKNIIFNANKAPHIV